MQSRRLLGRIFPRQEQLLHLRTSGIVVVPNGRLLLVFPYIHVPPRDAPNRYSSGASFGLSPSVCSALLDNRGEVNV